jgi:hypothetical protein
MILTYFIKVGNLYYKHNLFVKLSYIIKLDNEGNFVYSLQFSNLIVHSLPHGSTSTSLVATRLFFMHFFQKYITYSKSIFNAIFLNVFF